MFATSGTKPQPRTLKLMFLVTIAAVALFFIFFSFSFESAQAQGNCACNMLGELVADECWHGYHAVCDTGGTCYCVEDDDPIDPGPTTVLQVRSQIDGQYTEGLTIENVGGLEGTGGTTNYDYIDHDGSAIPSTTLRAPETFNQANFVAWSRACDSASDRDCTVSVSADQTKTVIARYEHPAACTLSVSKTEVMLGESFELKIEAEHHEGVNSAYYKEGNTWSEKFDCGNEKECTATWDLVHYKEGTYKYKGGFWPKTGDFVHCPEEVKVKVKKVAECSFSLSDEEVEVDEKYQLTVEAKHSDGVKSVHYRENNVWSDDVKKCQSNDNKEFTAVWDLSQPEAGEYRYRTGFYSVNDEWVWCPGTKSIEVIETEEEDLTSSMEVVSRVDGVSKQGVTISWVSGTEGTDGQTNYSQDIEGAINTTIEAPEDFNGAEFSQWSDCQSASGRQCTIDIEAGQSTKVTVSYTTPSPTGSCTLSVSETSVETGEAYLVAVEAQHSQGVSKVYYNENDEWSDPHNCQNDEECRAEWWLSQSQAGSYRYLGGFYPTGSDDFIYCPEDITVTVSEPSPATNTLRVRSRVDGSLFPGAEIERISGPDDIGDTTPYSRQSTDPIVATLEAPDSLGGANFNNWSGCQSVSERQCSVEVKDGGTRTITVRYVTPAEVVNTLVVESWIGDSPQAGADIEHVSGTAGTDGKTRYDVTRASTIEVVLEAPPKHLSANFVTWEGCDDDDQGLQCPVTVKDGETKTIKARYEYGAPDWKEV